MNDQLNAVVIGCGALGQHHARLYEAHPQTRLLAVVDIDEGARSSANERWGCGTAASLDEIEERIDLASVVTPTVSHFEIASRLIEAGVSVLVEKPIAMTVEEGDRMTALARARDVVMQVGHIERFNPAVRALGSHLQNPLFIESHRLGPLAPRVKDVGVVLDLMIHDLDLILALVKSDLKSVDAVGVPVVTPREDIANARLRFVSGCVANVTVSRVTPDRMRKIRFFQPDAYLSLDYLKPELQIYRKITGTSGAVRIEHETPALSSDEPLAAEIDSFIQAVIHGREPLVTGEDGVRALRIAEEITQQAQASVSDLAAKSRSFEAPVGEET